MSTRRRGRRGMARIRRSRSREKVCRCAVYNSLSVIKNTHYCSTYSSAHTSKHPSRNQDSYRPNPRPSVPNLCIFPYPSLSQYSKHTAPSSYSNSSSQPFTLLSKASRFLELDHLLLHLIEQLASDAPRELDRTRRHPKLLRTRRCCGLGRPARLAAVAVERVARLLVANLEHRRALGIQLL